MVKLPNFVVNHPYLSVKMVLITATLLIAMAGTAGADSWIPGPL